MQKTSRFRMAMWVAALSGFPALVACHGDTVTGPDATTTATPPAGTPTTAATRTSTRLPSTTPSPTPSATPTPAAIDLSGNWSGITHEHGRTDEFFCPGGGGPVTAGITQAVDQVTIAISNTGACGRGGPVTFTGRLVGSQLSGALISDVSGIASCRLVGGASGTASAASIHLEGRLAGPCDDVAVTIDLTR